MVISPAIHIKEGKNNYRIEMVTPGFKKDDFSIYTKGNTLIISFKKELKPGPEEGEVIFPANVGSYSYFLRFPSLPDDVDSDRVTARYNGILKLQIPKKNIRVKRNKKSNNQ